MVAWLCQAARANDSLAPLQISLWNFIKYNVAGGGESALYGTEPWHFYLVNGFLNFNLMWLLALWYPVTATLQATGIVSKPLNKRLLMAVAPLYVWLAAISALPHKEERFLYVVYPQVCPSSALLRQHLCSQHAVYHTAIQIKLCKQP